MRTYRRNNEAGTGMGEVLLFVGLFAVVWFSFYFALSWIYSTKEGRVERAYQANVKKVDARRLLHVQRGPGSHKVKCSGFVIKKCREQLG